MCLQVTGTATNLAPGLFAKVDVFPGEGNLDKKKFKRWQKPCPNLLIKM